MSKPSVNVVLRLDSSKVKDDAEKAKSILTTSIGPTVDVFGVATRAVELFGKSLEVAGKGLVFLTERTGAAQALNAALDDTRKAIGEAADRSGALTQAMSAIETTAREIGTYFRSPEGREAINGFFKAIATGAADGLDAMLGLYKLAEDLSFEIEGRLKGVAVRPLDAPAWVQSAQSLSDRLRTSGTDRPENNVRERGTYVDEDAEKTRKAMADARSRSDAERERQMDAALGRAKAQADEQRKIDMYALDEQRKLAELRRTIDENVNAYMAENAARRADLRQKEIDRQSALDMDALRGAEANASLMTDLAAQATGGIANAITSGAAAIASGGDLGAAVASAMGGAVAALGATLIATGTGVLAGAALASIVPGLAALFPPWSTGAALGAIAAGTALVGGGTYVQMLAAGGASAPSTAGAATSSAAPAPRSTGFRGTPLGFQDMGSGGNRTTILNYNFNGPMGGSPRRIAREIRDLTTAGDTLLPGFRPVGGR
jgi:hypothetical protein